MLRNIGRLRAGGSGFSYASLFAAGEPGVHYETYNPDSLLQRRNRLTYSEDFTNAVWTKENCALTAAAVANPLDGAVTATLLLDNATNGTHGFIQTPSFPGSGAAGSGSVYVKPYGSLQRIAVLLDNSGQSYAYFNIIAGTVVGTAGTSIDLSGISIAPAGNGWYRITSARAARTDGLLCIRACQGATNTVSYAGTGTDGFYVYGAQAEHNTVATSAYQKVTDWNTEYLAAAGASVHMWQDNLRTVPVTAVEQTVGCWDDLSPNAKHATQGTAGSRPKLSARYNLLTKTEQLDDAAWTKTGTSVVSNAVAGPTGALIADKVVMSAGSSTHTVMQNGPFSNGGLTPHVFRFMLKDAGQRFAQIGFANTGWASSYANFDLVNGVVGSFGGAAATGSAIRALGDGWYECSVTTTAPTAAGNPLVFLSGCATAADGYNPTFVGDGVSGFYSAGGDLRTTSDASLAQPAYQRVNTATDYDTAGFIHYLKGDGIDDGLTATLDLSAVNKVSVWIGETKLSDAAAGVMLEHTATASGTDGAFGVWAPNAASGNNVQFTTRGTVAAATATVNGLASPVTSVLVAQYDNAGATTADQVAVRVNGVAQAATLSGTTTAGNFAASTLNIFRRNNTGVPFNGRLTSVTVRGSTTPSSVAFIKSMEQYAAKLAGQTFTSA